MKLVDRLKSLSGFAEKATQPLAVGIDNLREHLSHLVNAENRDISAETFVPNGRNFYDSESGEWRSPFTWRDVVFPLGGVVALFSCADKPENPMGSVVVASDSQYPDENKALHQRSADKPGATEDFVLEQRMDNGQYGTFQVVKNMLYSFQQMAQTGFDGAAYADSVTQYMKNIVKPFADDVRADTDFADLFPAPKLAATYTGQIGDFNGDGKVTFDDFFLFADAFGAKRGEKNYEERFDLVGDGQIGFGDFFLLADNFGKSDEDNARLLSNGVYKVKDGQPIEIKDHEPGSPVEFITSEEVNNLRNGIHIYDAETGQKLTDYEVRSEQLEDGSMIIQIYGNGEFSHGRNIRIDLDGIVDNAGNPLADSHGNSYQVRLSMKPVANAPPVLTVKDTTAYEDFGLFGFKLNVKDDITPVSELLMTAQSYDSRFPAEVRDGWILVESMDSDASGDVNIKVTAAERLDSGGVNISEEYFNLNVKPMTDIRGTLLDTDTWEPNPDLKGWVVALGDTVWADSEGRYNLQVPPQAIIDSLTAGYKDADGRPASFVRTIRNLDGSNDQDGVDIAILQYADLEYTSPEELKAIIVYSNSATYFDQREGYWVTIPRPYTEADDNVLRGLNQDQSILISKHNKRRGRDYSEEELTRLVEDITRIQSGLPNPLPISIDRSSEGFYPTTEAEAQSLNLIYKEGPHFARSDFDGDGRMDFLDIAIMRPTRDQIATEAEFISGLDAYEPVHSDLSRNRNDGLQLINLTIIYEQLSTENPQKTGPKEADIKRGLLVKGITWDVGHLHPLIPVKDVLKLPYK